MQTETSNENSPIKICKLRRGDSFRFHNDVKKHTYIYNSCKGRYARVVDDVENLYEAEEWAFVSTESLVYKIVE